MYRHENRHTWRERTGGSDPGSPFSRARSRGYGVEPQSAAGALARGRLGWAHRRRLDCRNRAERCVYQPGGAECGLPLHGGEPGLIYESRIRSTLLLNEVISTLNPAPRLWVNASTATIYRHALDRAMDEATGELGGNEPGAPDTWNFSIGVAKGWEQAFFSTPTPRTRKIAIRSAITFSPDRGESSMCSRGLSGVVLAADRGPALSLFPGFTRLTSCGRWIC